MAQGQILYALVARETNVLAEHQTPAVPFDLPTATRLVLQRIPMEDKRHTYEFDQEFLFVCLVSEGICYLCLCQQNAELRRVFGYLEDVKKRFMQRFAAEAYTAHTLALNAAFAPVLEARLVYFNTDPEAMFTVSKHASFSPSLHTPFQSSFVA
jgi:vesicle-associated membrane protein 7